MHAGRFPTIPPLANGHQLEALNLLGLLEYAIDDWGRVRADVAFELLRTHVILGVENYDEAEAET